jgi:diguanylate cyclase (GGDEF)-like protein
MSELLLGIIYFLTLTALITAIYGSLQREANHSLYVILLSLAIAFFSLGSLLVLASKSAETAFMGFRIQHIGQPFIGGLWFLYTMDVCGYTIRKRPMIVLLMALPVVMSFGVTSGDPLGLFIRSLSYEQDSILPKITGNFTPLYNVGLLHIYGFNIASGAFIVSKIFRQSEKSKNRLFIHFFAGLFTLLVGVIAVILKNPYKRELASASLCIFSVLLNIYLLKTGAFRIVAKAKYQLFESVQDGIVIVNKRNEYMDANDKAKYIFPVLAEVESGTPIAAIDGFFPVSSQTNRHENEFTVTNDNTKNHYTVTRSELLEDNQYIGSTFMIYDITKLKNLTVMLEELATIDELTQVNNRRNFFLLTEGMIVTMKRLGTYVCVAMMDIDDFKQVNDTYGHVFGDEVLKTVALQCKTLLRQSDVLGRYGGEEFGIAFYGMDLDSAIKRLDQLRQSISEIKICQGTIKTNVTVSIGFSFVDYGAEYPLKYVISQADLALYKAKQSGKNKVCGMENNSKCV